MQTNSHLYDLPFDQFSRQIQVKNVLDSLRPKKGSLKILDVGGYRGATKVTLPDDDVTVVDMFNISEDHYVKGDGTNLPFRDKEFDYVLSFDVLEHVPDDKRRLFIEESARVSKHGIIIAFPIKSSKNEYAERSLNRLYKQLHGKDHKWLKEHIDNTIPDSDVVLSVLKDLKLKPVLLTSNDTDLWISMQSAIFLTSKYPELGHSLMVLNRQYNKLFEGFDGSSNKQDNYRHIYLGFKSNKDYASINQQSFNKIAAWSEVKKLQIFEDITQFYNANIKEISEANKIRVQNSDFILEIKELKSHNKKNDEIISNIVNSKKYKLLEKISKLQIVRLIQRRNK